MTILILWSSKVSFPTHNIIVLLLYITLIIATKINTKYFANWWWRGLAVTENIQCESKKIPPAVF